MKHGACLLAIVCALAAVGPEFRSLFAGGDDDDTSHQLSLADLAGYRAALSGKPTADQARATDPPAEVKFKDLWDHPDVFQGRRVVVQGRVVRTFRQGPVGSFPPLAEVWITSPAGDPFCVVFPRPGASDGKEAGSIKLKATPPEKTARDATSEEMPRAGGMVRFTGTFLKMVRYAGADTTRLAPLVVGDRTPVLISSEPVESPVDAELAGTLRGSGLAIRLACWALGLAAAATAAVALARWHLRMPAGSSSRRGKVSERTPDLPLEFLEPPGDA